MTRLMITLVMTAWTIVMTATPFIRNYPATAYHAHNQNFDIITGKDGTVYVANFEGLLYYDNASWHIIHTPNVTRITAVFCDSRGTIWTGGYNYMGYLESDSRGKLRLHDIDKMENTRGEVQWIWEKEGHIYFLMGEKGIYTIRNGHVVTALGEKLPEKGFSVFKTEAHINQVQQLDNGMLAIATSGDGLIFTDTKGHELFRITEDHGLCSNNVAHITYNGHGMIWGATDNGVFSIGYPSIYTHMTEHEGLRGEVCALQHLGGTVYAGTQSGLFRQQDNRFVKVEGIRYACWQLVRQGNSLLAATADGVYRIDPDARVSQLTTANTLSLLADEKGFYSGEMTGVFYNSATGRKQLSDIEKVVSIRHDKHGAIWLQNLYGLVWKSTDGQSFKLQHGTQDNANTMTTLVEYQDNVIPLDIGDRKPFPYPAFSYNDEQGVLWLTDEKGRSLYAFRDNVREVHLSDVVYPLMEYSVRAMLRDDKYLWIGGDKGINIVDYNRPNPSKVVKPHLYLRSVMLNADSVVWGGYGPMPDMLPEFSRKDRHITFYYSTAHQSLLLDTQYRYRLNNGNWTAWEFDTSQEFPNLPYGSYTFEVQARDAFGQLSNIVAVRFVIKTPLYMRWYMNISYLLLLALLAYIIFQLRLRRLEKDKLRLENLVTERTKDVVRLEKMASVAKLTQGLIDRILNPLNYINNFAKLSESLVKDVADNIEDERAHMDAENYEDTTDTLNLLKGNLQKIGEHGANTTRTLKAMEEMLKDRSGNMIRINLMELLHQDKEMVSMRYKNEIAQYGIKTTFSLPSGDIFINGNTEQLSKTFTCLHDNAVYAIIKKKQRDSNFKPEIILTVKPTADTVELIFHDNGVGIESTIIDKIFDPFFTTKTTGEASGVGLYLSREIAQNHGGDISVRSSKDIFTEFTITLPTA